MKRRDSDYSRSGRRGGACVISLIVIAALTTAAQTAGAEVGSGEVTLQPRQPYGLAAATNGAIYVADVARDQVLKRDPSGRFSVFAGNGHEGFAGDGGAAVDAELRLTPVSGLAPAPDGGLYVSDSGNGRVRLVDSKGVIRTVAGGGGQQVGTGAVKGVDAQLRRVAGLATGSGGVLYIAAGNVFALTRAGMLSWVVGKYPSPLRCGSVYCNPASQADFASSQSVAVDSTADLYVSSSYRALYERTRGGRLLYITQFIGHVGQPGLIASQGGVVLGASRLGVTRFVGRSSSLLINMSRLSNALGDHNGFIAGDGLAVTPSGGGIVDVNEGDGWTSKSAIISVNVAGKATVVWQS